MRFHREGIPSLILALVFSAIIIFIAQYGYENFAVAHWFAYLLSAFLIITILQFFRHPKREHNTGDNLIIAPADGTVVVIEETYENEIQKDKRIQVSIFMSPINVHVNRFPISGTVSYCQYHAGKFLAAWEPKSSTDNERTTVVVTHKNGKQILFRQIAGALARRIKCYVKEGASLEQGQEFGFIKFGSRVDVYLPVDAIVKVSMGEVTRGGKTVIAELK